jgi:hypothetical protein
VTDPRGPAELTDPYCPYTAEPNSSGQWHAPDHARARELIAASGTKGMRIDVWGTMDGFVPQGVPRYFTSLLRKLGYQVKLHLEPSSSITAECL